VLSSAAVLLFAQGAALGFSSAAAPGPFQAYLLAEAVRHGPRRSAALALVPLVSDPPLIGAVLAVLTQVPAGFLRALQLAGGGFVLWLGIAGLRALRRASGDAPAPAEPPRGFVRAVVVNFTNPNAWIFWSLVGGPILASAWRSGPAPALGFLAGFYLLLCGGNAVLVLAFGAAGRLGPGVAKALGGLSAAALLAFGAWQVGRGIAG
jgi:threonine/homoserine/homoserine lactone efflux protein